MDRHKEQKTDGCTPQKLTRREFTRISTAAGLAASAGVGSFLAHEAAAAAPEAGIRKGFEEGIPDGKYVDFHTRLGQIWGNRPPLTAGALVHWMNENDIAQAVVHPMESPEGWDHPIPTHYVLEHTEPFRHRLIPAAVIDPRVLNLRLGDRDNVTPLLQRYVDYGARLFGEHNPGVQINDPINMDLFASVAEVGLPVLLQMNHRSNFDGPGLPGLEEVLKAYPDTPFIGHGSGFWAGISGDAAAAHVRETPSTPIRTGGAVIRLMDGHPNLYADLGGESGAHALRRDPDFGREFIISHADRLVWSSSYSWPRQNIPQLNLFDEFDLPEDVQARVFRENALRLLRLVR